MDYQFTQARVAVYGDLVLDRYLFGAAKRTSSEAPVAIVDIEKTDDRLGCAGNVVANIQALQAQSIVSGLLGADQAGDSICQLFDQIGAEQALKRSAENQTIIKQRVLSQNQQLIRLDFETRYQTDNEIAKQVLALLPTVNGLVISDYDKGTVTDASSCIQRARELGIPVVIDPVGVDYECYRGATVIVANNGEFQAVVGPCGEDLALIEKRAQNLRQSLALQALIITRGKHGMLVVTEHDTFSIPAPNQDVYDVTGASDTVVATLATALAAGYDIQIAAKLANTAAGLVVRKLGTASVNAYELNQAMQKQTQQVSMQLGCVSTQELKSAVKMARQQGETIAMANGCFDLLHAGHVTYLQSAKKYGDRLMVAINDDASIKRLKGESRPVLDLATRMQMLEALEVVDWVVAFSSDTPEPLLEEIKPDVLVKGGDYSEDQIVGGEFVKSYGGKIHIIPHPFAHCSTSKIVEKMQQQEEG